MYRVEDENGYLVERTPDDASVQVEIGSIVSGSTYNPIEVIIEGQSGDCTISGEAYLLVEVSGTCESGVATLTIDEEYELYRRSVQCPGQPAMEYTDSVIPYPGYNGEFNLSQSGDTQGVRQELDQFTLIYEYTLRPEELVPIVPEE